MSKTIDALERELGRKLFDRSRTGVRVTPYGKTVLEYASVILKNASMINSMADRNTGKKFSLITYPSQMIARLLTEFYAFWKDAYVIEHQEGTVEDICNHVSHFPSWGFSM